MNIARDTKTIKANFRKAKVLVIEDNADHWTLISNAMQQCLPEVAPVRAATSSEALAYLGEWTLEEWQMPKLILLDLYLPNREDGWKLLRKIRTLPAPCNQIPVVMLTNSNNPADINEAYRLGSSSYLVKPCSFEGWTQHFQQLRAYWWETVTLPPLHLML